MSATLKLTRTYNFVFFGCSKFAVSPYIQTFNSIMDNREQDRYSNCVEATIICGILTFVVPVLPVLCIITTALATVAMALAIVTMMFTYPVALIMDGCAPDDIEEAQEESLCLCA